MPPAILTGLYITESNAVIEYSCLSIFYPLFIRVIMEVYPEDVPSMNNIYSSKYWEKVKADEQARSNDMYEKAKNPFKTGVISKPAYSDMFMPQNNGNNANNNYVASLTGEQINIGNFTHNNMQPFLRKNVTQNTNVEAFTSKLDMSMGTNSFWKKKEEVPCFFEPTANSGGNICGMKNNDDFYKSRIELSGRTNNYFPIQSVRVGPGLNQGYGSEGVGGFQQTDSLDYAKPRNIDDLRSKINQKNTYFEIPFQAPIQGTAQRGVVAPYKKNRPDTTYRQTEDQWLKTTGAITKETARPVVNVKATARPDLHKEYKGSVKHSTAVGIKDDYGKQNVMVYNNERQTTQSKTVVSNLTSIVKAIVAPVVDAMKYTMKEYTVEAPRGVGNPSIQIPEKPTLYDPDNHIMRTTVKETTVHDSEMNNLTGAKETYSALEDVARTTVKETTIHDGEMNNLTGNKETYSALQDLAKTTVKETMIHDTTITNIKAGDAGYTVADDEAKKTLRQTLKKEDTVRNIGARVYKVYVYDPDMKAKNTMKQTTIKGKSEFGFLGGLLEGLFGGYLSTPVELKNTQKQFLSDTNEYGIAGAMGEHRQTDRYADENAEIDGTREAILMAAGHTPNPSNRNIGIDAEDVEMYSKKPVENDLPYRENGNVGVVYQTGAQRIDECGITKMPDKRNAFENRLDSDLLEPIRDNDLVLKINPIKAGCKL